jgi:hypothetical protein
MNPTHTPAFKLWFENSKVVDASARPLVAYHGTDAEFPTFDFSRTGNPDTEGGPFFTSNRMIAQDYGDRIVSAYLVIKQPYILTYKRWLNESGPSVPELKKLGHDGIIITDFTSNGRDGDADENPDVGRVFIPWSAEQIKVVNSA